MSAAVVRNRPILLVCLAVFGLMTGQQMVNPILPPLARELGFSEFALGIVWTVGAAGVVVGSAFWSRRSMTWGHRAVLLISLLGSLAGLLGFAVVAQFGLAGVLTGTLLFALILLSRGVVFGLAWGATPVTAQSYVADVTSGTAERVRGMSKVGAAQGLGMAVGPALGGMLSVAGLLVPLYVAPAILAVVALVVAIGLPRPPAHRVRPPAARVSPFDRRMWPFLTSGFGMFLAFGIVLMTIGFLVQDRLHLATEQTGQVTGFVLLAGSSALILVQAVAVPRLGWAPLRLIRTGAVVMTAGMVGMVLAANGPLLGVAMAVLGAGLGFGLPGVMAAPTLLTSREEQGAVAGLVGTSNAITFMLGPLLGTGLYEIAPVVPYLLGTVLLAGLAVFTFVHPGVRQVPEAATAGAG